MSGMTITLLPSSGPNECTSSLEDQSVPTSAAADMASMTEAVNVSSTSLRPSSPTLQNGSTAVSPFKVFQTPSFKKGKKVTHRLDGREGIMATPSKCPSDGKSASHKVMWVGSKRVRAVKEDFSVVDIIDLDDD